MDGVKPQAQIDGVQTHIDAASLSSVTWWDRYLETQWSDGGGVVVIAHLSCLGLQDGDIPSLVAALKSYVVRNVDSGSRVYLDLDASGNSLSDETGVHLITALHCLMEESCGCLCVRALKLQKNCLGDATCGKLALLTWSQKEPIQALSLSHNVVGCRGMAALLIALALHREAAYPRRAGDKFVPTWVRLDYNVVDEVDMILSLLEKHPVRLRGCLGWHATCSCGRKMALLYEPPADPAYGGELGACDGGGRGGCGKRIQAAGGYFHCGNCYFDSCRDCIPLSCTPAHCIHALTKEMTPHVHLPWVHKQKQAMAPQALQLEGFLESCVDFLFNSEVGREGHASAFVAQCVAPQNVVPYREVYLRVDPSAGAGLDLCAGTHGYYVEEVDALPGQDLKVGEAIFEIEGEILWGDLDVEEIKRIFGKHFAHGARLRVADARLLQHSALWQPLGVWVALRNAALRESLYEDLDTMGNMIHVVVELHEQDGAVSLRGPAKALRSAVEDLRRLTAFYFPEIQAAVLPTWHAPRGLPEATQDAPVLRNSDKVPKQPAQAPPPHLLFQEQVTMTCWEARVKEEYSEDDDLCGELPAEPVVPEESDETTGNLHERAVLPDLACPLRVLLLVGLPGSGKSSLAAWLRRLGWTVVSQDSLGCRKACVAAAQELLLLGRRVVVDRCNATRLQRREWLAVAAKHDVCTACIWLDIPEKTCCQRILQRFGQQECQPPACLDIVSAFAKRLEAPTEAEGFVRWRVADGELDEVLAQLEGLLHRSEKHADQRPSKVPRVSKDDAPPGVLSVKPVLEVAAREADMLTVGTSDEIPEPLVEHEETAWYKACNELLADKSEIDVASEELEDEDLALQAALMARLETTESPELQQDPIASTG